MWKKSIDVSELIANQQIWQVVSSHLVSGKTQIRVYSDAAPDVSFAPTEATLEDVYFMKLNRTPVTGSERTRSDYKEWLGGQRPPLQ